MSQKTSPVTKKSPVRTIDIKATAALHPRWWRLWEIIPGLCTWLLFILPFVLGRWSPQTLAFLIVAYSLWWLIKAFSIAFRMIRAYRKLRAAESIAWKQFSADLQDRSSGIKRTEHLLGKAKSDFERDFLEKHLNVLRDASRDVLMVDELQHLIIVAAYNEGRDILGPTMESLTKQNIDPKKMIVVLAYEERGGPDIKKTALALARKYQDRFASFTAIMHPDGIPGEHQGKGANITYAAREITADLKKQKIDPENIIVTTLDADNRASHDYFAYLQYEYAINPKRKYKSYQPIPTFFNNIWDVPAPMRVIAIGNSFWMLSEVMRPHRLRNFAAHSQPLTALIETDFWSVQTIVEDGHHFWRSYFQFDGQHEVVPIYASVYQDAVLSHDLRSTFRAQFVQLRRWAWGASDIAYVFVQSMMRKDIPFGGKFIHFMRLFEGHFSWSTSALLLMFGAWIPLLLNQGSDELLIYNLPQISAWIQRCATIGIIVSVIISMLWMPKRPARYGRSKSVLMVLQWLILPFTIICFNSMAAIVAQTRLMLGRYLENFDVTDKVVKK